jgi:glycosyltransferase involved in cell wall biosynthesis
MFLEDEGYRVELLPIRFSRRLPAYHRSAIREIRGLLGSGGLRMEADEVCVLATEPFYPVARVWNRSVILFFGNSPPLGLGWKGKLNYAYATMSQMLGSLPAAKLIMPCSYFLQGSLPAFSQRKAVVLYPGVDHYDRWTPTDEETLQFRRNLGVKDDEAVLFHAGRLNTVFQPYKGLNELVSHFQSLRSARSGLHLIVAGYGDDRDESLLKEQGVIVFRNAPRNRMPLLFRACDIYCTASRWEGFDLPLAEAQHFGKPVIAYEIGAHHEVVSSSDSGYLVENPAAFRSTLEFMVDNRPWCREMGDRGRQRVARFRWRYSVETLESHLLKVFGGS